MYMQFDFTYVPKDQLLASIFVDYFSQDVKVTNYTDDIFMRPFGVVDKPTFSDFEKFLQSRCVPETRHNVMSTLKALGVDFYDPLIIVTKLGGFQYEDNCDLRYVGDVNEIKE